MRLLVLFILANISILYGQDIQFSQTYASPLMQNPAFCGAQICNRFTLTNRIQWNGINPGYNTFLASYDHSFASNNMSVGLMTGKDVSGSGDLKKIYFTPVIANEVRVSRSMSIHGGLSFGVGQVSINYDKLIFGDQIARGGDVETVESLPASRLFIDINAGVLMLTPKYWAGLSINHFNKPNEALIGSSDVITPMKIQFQGGYKHYIEGEDARDKFEKSLSISSRFKIQNNFKQFDLGGYYTYNKFTLGLWYRNIPFLSNQFGPNTYNDAIILVAGVQLEKINIGYSYDITVSSLTVRSGGSHEVTMAIQFCNKNRRRPKPVLISCPKF